jgi:AcrR family transcriptional regulator
METEMTLQDTASRPLGLRERNKRDKLKRIKDAARALFVAKGFDDTTTREIAHRAGVGLGTIFVYAENKRDLLFLIVNEELEDVTRAAGETIDPAASLLDNLLTVARLHYRFFGEQAALSRLVLREMAFYESGTQADRFQSTRQRLIDLFGQSVELALAQGAVATKESPQFVGWTLFCIFQVELRRWLSSDASDLNDGLGTIERALSLFINGLKPTPKAIKRRTGLPANADEANRRRPTSRKRAPSRS